jgi:hypothetical protein
MLDKPLTTRRYAALPVGPAQPASLCNAKYCGAFSRMRRFCFGL